MNILFRQCYACLNLSLLFFLSCCYLPTFFLFFKFHLMCIPFFFVIFLIYLFFFYPLSLGELEYTS